MRLFDPLHATPTFPAHSCPILSARLTWHPSIAPPARASRPSHRPDSGRDGRPLMEGGGILTNWQRRHTIGRPIVLAAWAGGCAIWNLFPNSNPKIWSLIALASEFMLAN